MSFNVWNIKEMLSIPPGAGFNKSSQNAASSNHSSQTDSQFLFSSQFGPDNSQPACADYKSQRNSNSQDNEPSAYQKYISKPPLCVPEGKERGQFQSFGTGKTKSIIEQFEETKRKAKEKQEIEQFNQMICNIHVTVEELKMTLCQMEENTHLKCRSIVESINSSSKSLQENIAIYHESIQKVASSKCDCRQALQDLESKIVLKDAELTDLKSNVQLLVTGMEAVKSRQCEMHLELSEKLTCLSDSIKSSEDKILSEIHKINWVPKPATDLKDQTTQTSPASVQDLLVTEHITSQCKPSRTCLGGSQNTCEGTSGSFSPQHEGTVCLKDMTNCSAGHDGKADISAVDLRPPEIYTRSRARHERVEICKDTTMDETGVKYVCGLQQYYHNNRGLPTEQNHFLQKAERYSGEENGLIGTKSKKNIQTSRRTTANRRRKISKKKRTALAIKNTTQAISSSASNNAERKSRNEFVIRQHGNSVRQMEDCLMPFSESCESSLPVIPALMRKAQKKNCLKYSLLDSRQTIKQPTKMGSGGDDCLAKTLECSEDGGMSIWDSSQLFYNADPENNMPCFPSLSPSVMNTSAADIIVQMEQKKLISFFFDSSEDSG